MFRVYICRYQGNIHSDDNATTFLKFSMCRQWVRGTKHGYNTKLRTYHRTNLEVCERRFAEGVCIQYFCFWPREFLINYLSEKVRRTVLVIRFQNFPSYKFCLIFLFILKIENDTELDNLFSILFFYFLFVYLIFIPTKYRVREILFIFHHI